MKPTRLWILGGAAALLAHGVASAAALKPLVPETNQTRK